MNPFFEELGDEFVTVAHERGAEIEKPTLDPELSDELLLFASIVAHSRERKFAPLACYLAGVAAAQIDQASVLELVRAVRKRVQPPEESA
ncbi:MAG: hypothetical protein JO359_05580 [Candidatus Eremiobacteraeota bacterium]|nr:hypothetical protein [Candidatus Eremiobacteraeota bacterium]